MLFYFVVIIAGLLRDAAVASTPSFRDLARLLAIAMSVFANLVFEIGGLLGYGTLKGLLIGRYVQPKREQRVFLLIDMKNSTGLAERLGPIRFHELLNEFFRDIVRRRARMRGRRSTSTWATRRS